MKDYLLFMDVSGDILMDENIKEPLNFIPMTLSVGESTTLYNGNNSADELKKFYDDIRDGMLVKTSQITPYIYEEYFTSYLKDGKDILYLCLSSGLSSTYESACQAARNLEITCPDAKLYPVDSLSATGGMGMIIERAINNKSNGLTIEDNIADIESLKQRLYINCFVEDLMHLKRGGRISAATAAFGTLLNIKPLIQLTSKGTLEQFSKCNGEKQSVRKMASVYKDKGQFDSSTPVYICDADNRKTAEFLGEIIREINPNCMIKFVTLSPIIGAHLGPSSVVLCFEIK